jgi:hypothetical protein
MKLPSFQSYPSDWMKDPGLRSVSLEARGLWIDILCLIFESGRRGYLQHATGKAVSGEQLPRTPLEGHRRCPMEGRPRMVFMNKQPPLTARPSSRIIEVRQKPIANNAGLQQDSL